MATIAVSNATLVSYQQSVLEMDGFPVENWRLAAGSAPGDTIVITPNRFKLIKAVLSGQGHNLPAISSGGLASNVTITIPAFGASDATTPQQDIWIVGIQR
jgi:hypothetical protein